MANDNSVGRLTAVVSWLLGAILIFASLFRAGQGPIPLLILQLFAVLMLLLSFWTPTRSHSLTKPEVIALALLLLFPFSSSSPCRACLWSGCLGVTNTLTHLL